MKQALILALLLLSLSAMAIVCLPGSAANTSQRETTFAYHTGTDDFRFYGSSTWAVRFDLTAVYPSDPDSYFSAQAAVLWFPQLGDSVKVELFNESAGQPAQRLAIASAAVTQNSMIVPFPQAVQAQVVWMLVTYNTNFTNRFVAASAGDGSHSYYLNSNAENPYLQSLATAGYNAELLFGLSGDFVTSYTDLELRVQGFYGTLMPRELIHPAFTIYNHSSLSLSDATYNLVITSPVQGFSHNLTIPIQETIAPQSLYTWGPQSNGYYQYSITLPDTPLMFKARGILSAASAITDTLTNNSSTKYYQAFSDSPPLYQVETFARYANIADIMGQQDLFDPAQLHRLVYLPVLTDTLSTIGSIEHFNWYLFNSTPRTVIGGDARITGFSAGYATQYQTLVQETLNDNTFITNSECRFTSQSLDSVTAEITLFNNNTQLFTSTAEYNLAANCRWFMGLFRAVPIAGQTRWVLHRWIAHATNITGNLNAGESSVQTHPISLSGLDLDGDQYRIYYWLQMNNGGQVYYMNWADLNANVSASDPAVVPASLRFWPNPLSGQTGLRVSFPDLSSYRSGVLKIFNLRGQLLYKASLSPNASEIPAALFPTSGIYLIKAELTGRDGRETSISKRLTVIK